MRSTYYYYFLYCIIVHYFKCKTKHKIIMIYYLGTHCFVTLYYCIMMYLNINNINHYLIMRR